MPLVTDKMIYNTVQNNVMNTTSTVQTTLGHAQSGLRVMTPADDPAAAGQEQIINAGISQLAGMTSASDQVSQALGLADSGLRQTNTLLARAKELSVQAANGNMTATQRNDIGLEIQSIHDQVLAIANTETNGVYLYAGYADGTQPFATDGTYSGDAGVRQVQVAPGMSVSMNLPGSQVFNVTGGSNVIGMLQQLATDTQANNVAGIVDGIELIDTAVDQIALAQSQVGVQMNALNSGNMMRTQVQTVLAQSLNDTVQVDAAAAFTDMMQAQSAYQAAIAEATRILSGLNQGLL